MSTNVYTYGIISQESLELSVNGVAGADSVYTVDHRSLSAVVSDIETTEPDRTDEAVETHNNVLQQILEYDGGRTVVPMSFGMGFKDTRTLKGVLRGARPTIESTLEKISGTVELGVKIIAPATGRLSRDAVQSTTTELLSAASINETDNDLFTDRLIVNKSYLVDRDHREAFDDAVDEIEAEYGDTVTVQYTGPWPPYNFVDIRIGADQGGR
ncbi:MAG: gas vesicle synthesis protein GvpL/GvpF [halophilic archaeon J07HX5]|jgi:Gas vesicle synthesis protein GvpL/GvpF.|nr:MAG: gas vesicle synthesis protein GvpL/GvpF [halophilic archaeon J07HX5]